MGIFDRFRSDDQKKERHYFKHMENYQSEIREWATLARDRILKHLAKTPFSPSVQNDLNQTLQEFRSKIQELDSHMQEIRKNIQPTGYTTQNPFNRPRLNKLLSTLMEERHRLDNAVTALTDAQDFLYLLSQTNKRENDPHQKRVFYTHFKAASELYREIEKKPYAKTAKGEELLAVLDKAFSQHQAHNKQYVIDLFSDINNLIKKLHQLNNQPNRNLSTVAQLQNTIRHNLTIADDAVNTGLQIKDRTTWNYSLANFQKAFQKELPAVVLRHSQGLHGPVQTFKPHPENFPSQMKPFAAGGTVNPFVKSPERKPPGSTQVELSRYTSAKSPQQHQAAGSPYPDLPPDPHKRPF